MTQTRPEPKVIIIPAKEETLQDQKKKKNLRVAAYCRVSTKKDEQLGSYENQKAYYTEKIMANPNWTMADIFADEGITGTSACKRKDFLRMIRQCRKGKIDMILAKSVSRFARNTAECLEAIRQFRANGTTIFFEKENIDTARMSSELMTALHAAFSQSESESISGNMRWSYQKRMERGEYNPQSAGFGYCLKDGKLAILAGAGPMGLGALTYALHRDIRPKMVVVADVNQERLDRAAHLFPVEEAAADGIELHFVNTGKMEDPAAGLKEITGGTGFDDVFCYAPVEAVVELSSAVLGRDGCLNFFAGPTDKQFSARMNFYDVHYNSTHVMGTTGGNTDDMIESLRLTAENRIDPAVMVTHIGGLNAAAETTLNLPKIPGGKKLIYTHLNMPLIALTDLREMGEKDDRYTALADIVDAHKGLWCPEAEEYLLAHFEQE